MFALGKCLVGSLFLCLAPVPPDAPPDPVGKGYMGIWFAGSGENGSLAIDRVEAGKPAEKAGMRSGDVIVRVGTLTPTGTQQVIDHVTQYRPGATIEVEVKRGNERKTFQMKLATRPPDNEIGRMPVPQILIEP
jgi:S1-C subfamily serine protease